MTTEYLFETIPFAGEGAGREFEQEWLGQELGEFEEENERGRSRGRAGRRRPARPTRPRPRPSRPGSGGPPAAMPDWLAVPDAEPPADSGQPCCCTPPCDCAACQGAGQASAEPVDQPSDEEFGFETEAGALFETLEFEQESGGPSRRAGPAPASCTTSSVDCPPQGTPSAVLDAFAFDKSDLNAPRHGPVLVNVARRIIASQGTRTPIRSLLVAGHTDLVGDDDYNFGLARRRAETVARELCRTIERMKPGGTRGLALRLTSCGERQAKGRPEESRRVEIHLPAAPVGPRPPIRRPRCPPGVRERVRLHLKILTPPTRVPIDAMLAAMRQVYRPAGILVEVASRERLRLPTLEEVDVFCPQANRPCRNLPCPSTNLNAEHVALFRNRRNVAPNELAVYFVQSTVPGLNGTCAHPPGMPGVIVAATASRWTLAHEVGHVLGLAHVPNTDRLMVGGAIGGVRVGTDDITNPPPDLIATEVATMLGSNFTIPC